MTKGLDALAQDWVEGRSKYKVSIASSTLAAMSRSTFVVLKSIVERASMGYRTQSIKVPFK